MGNPEKIRTINVTKRKRGKYAIVKIKARILLNIIKDILPYNYNMIFSLSLVVFLFILPLFGIVLNIGESIVFYGGIVFFLFLSKRFYQQKEETLFLRKYRIILFISAIVSVLASKNILISFNNLMNLIFISVFLDLLLKHVDVKVVYKYLLYFSLIYSTIFILNKIGIIPLSADKHKDNFILQVWGHSYLATLLVFPIVAILYQLIFNKKIYQYGKLINCFVLFFLFVCLVLTNSRSALITIFFSFIYLIVFSSRSIKFKIIFFTITTLLIGCVYICLNLNTSRTIDGNRLEYWSEAYQAFIDRPLLGQGPGNFFYINYVFQNRGFVNTNYAHNSFLDFLSTYGLVFTGLLFTIILLALIYQKKHSPLNFILGFTGIINSLFEFSWSSLGILCISLFFIFYNYSKFYTKNNATTKFRFFIKCLFLLFFLSKTLSNFAFINKNYLLSVYFYPFNLDARTELAKQGKYLESNNILLKNYMYLYKLRFKNQLPEPYNLSYYHKVIELNPKESITEYSNLSSYYYQNNDFDNLESILGRAFEYIDVTQFSTKSTMNIGKINYYIGVDYWRDSNYDMAIDYFKKAVYFSQGWSHFEIELANAYWHANQKDLAIKQLTVECQKYPKSIPHCQQYLDAYRDDFVKPGNLDMFKEIESIDPYLVY